MKTTPERKPKGDDVAGIRPLEHVSVTVAGRPHWAGWDGMGSMTDEKIHVTVDGQSFSVTRDAAQENTYHFEWLNALESGYGFSIQRSSGGMTSTEVENEIRQFLAQVAPHSQRLP